MNTNILTPSKSKANRNPRCKLFITGKLMDQMVVTPLTLIHGKAIDDLKDVS